MLEDMNSDEKLSGRTPLLQVRSIVPVMEEGDLWPNKGFYLKVSDSSHAMCVSLPNEYDEMILNNELQLGQYIYVQKLESAMPVPILRDVKLAPGGRHPCVGRPQDLVYTMDLIGSQSRSGISFSDSESKMDKRNIRKKKMPLEKPRSVSVSRARPNIQENEKALRVRSVPTSPKKICELENTNSDIVKELSLENKNSDIAKELSNISVSCIDSDSDTPSLPCFLKPRSARRNWNGPTAGLKEWSCPQLVLHETKPLARSRSAGLPSYSSSRFDTSDDSSSCISSSSSISSSSCKSKIRSKAFRTSNEVRSSLKPRYCPPKEKSKIPKPIKPHVSARDKKRTETNVSWGSLPANIVKLGKEVVQHRDSALAAAVEALQEACAAERLVQCLSKYSELQSNKDNDPRSMVDSLLDLHNNLVQARLITQSLATFSQLSTDIDSISPDSTQEDLKLAVERKKYAASWIKSAFASDLNKFADPADNYISDSEETVETPTSNKLGPHSQFSKPKSTSIVRKQRKNGEIQFGVLTMKENLIDWVKGSSLNVSIDLDNALQIECRKCFLTYVEEFLDGVMSKAISTASDSELAGVMCRIKRVDGWLDVIMKKGSNLPNDEYNEDHLSEDEDIETCHRLKNKLYVVLLKHVERSALALENMSSIS
ncbi:Serine/threonine-protein kinase [Thalictrum thalictroides]|uniref:Serine/threonine-protein kinase n=1 Tax=Thalictrum thalictroides TaxID=46969 RepID=A0A7J6WDE7_THATH|nr:Serine/threonine-protein kinase [Thalictrum thalictroides]